MSSHGVELQRRAARTEPEWTFADLYSSLSISAQYQVVDIKISSDGKTEWMSVELIQPVHHIPEESCIFQSCKDGAAQSEQSAFSVLMTGACAVADKEKQEKRSESLLPEHMVVNNKKDQLHNDREVPNFPDAFEALSNYNDVVRKKESACLDQSILSLHASLLFNCLSEVWVELPEWKEVRDMMFNLATLAME